MPLYSGILASDYPSPPGKREILGDTPNPRAATGRSSTQGREKSSGDSPDPRAAAGYHPPREA